MGSEAGKQKKTAYPWDRRSFKSGLRDSNPWSKLWESFMLATTPNPLAISDEKEYSRCPAKSQAFSTFFGLETGNKADTLIY